MKSDTNIETPLLSQKRSLYFKGSNFLSAVLIILILVFLYRLNCLYPYVTDDFQYSFIYGETTRIDGIYDIFLSQARHYMEVNGRYTVHFLAQFMLSIEKSIFNIFNVIHYAGLAALICKLSINRVQLLPWMFILLTLWCIMPQPGATFFWLTGSFNYIWAAGIVMTFAICLLSPKRSLNIMALFLAIPAGNTHEGIVIGVLVFLVLYSIILKKKSKLRIISLILFFVGILSNVLAPGTFQRLQTTSNLSDSTIQTLCIKCTVSIYKIIKQLFSPSCDWGVQVCVILFFITAVYLIRKLIKKKHTTIDILAFCILIGALFNFCMILPTGLTYGRVLFGFCFLCYLAFCVAFLCKLQHLRSHTNVILLSFAILFFSITYIKAHETVNFFALRMKYIETCLKGGEKTIRDLSTLNHTSHRYVDTYCMFANEIQNHFVALYYNTEDFAVLSPHLYRIMINHSHKMQKMRSGEWFVTKENHMIYCLNEKPRMAEIQVDAFGSTSAFDKYIPQFVKKLHQPGRRHTNINIFTMYGRYFATWDMQAATGKLSILYNGETRIKEVYFNISES